MAAKAALYLSIKAGLANRDLARKLGWDEKDVRRAIEPRQPTKLLRIKEALHALGKHLVVSIDEAA